MARLLNIAMVQMTSSQDVAENIEVASSYIEEAASDGAELIATPEMTSFLERSRKQALAGAYSQEKDPALRAFQDLAATLSVHLLIGSVPIKLNEDRLVNRSFLIGCDGCIVASYDKIHLFDVDLGGGERYRESDTYQAGAKAVIAEAGKARLGLSVCYDLRFPNLYRALACAGAEIITVPAAFTEKTGRAHWHVLLRARAIETGCFVLAPAQTGHHADGRSTFGHSLVVDPWGEIVVDGGTQPGVFGAQIDLDAVGKARGRVPSLLHGKDFTIG